MTRTRRGDIWMPLYISDYLADTTHLTTAQHGAYLLLLMAAWKRGATLPDNDEQLAQIARCDGRAWKAMRPVIEEFFLVEGNVWTQKRLAEEFSKAGGIVAKRAEAGKKGAEKRWKNDGKPIANAMANAMATEQQTPSQDDAPSQSPLHKPNTATTGDHQPSSLAHAEGGDPARPDPDRIASLVRLLLFHGVHTALGHPDLIALAEAQPTIEEVEGAIGEARRYKPAPQRIPVSYLVSVVASRRAARVVPPRNARDIGRQIAAATAFPDDDPPDRGAIDGSAIRVIR